MKVIEVLLEATDFLYHYTDLEGFVGIIKSGKIEGFEYPISGTKKQASIYDNKPQEKEIATTRNKRINPSLSSGVGPFRFRIETKYINKKIRNINELVVDAVKYVSKSLDIPEKKAHNLMTDATKSFKDIPLDKKEGAYRLKRSFLYSAIRKEEIQKDENSPVAKIYEKYKEIERKYLGRDEVEERVFQRFKDVIRVYASYYSFAVGKGEREQEERINADSIALSKKYIQFEFLKGASSKIEKNYHRLNSKYPKNAKTFKKSILTVLKQLEDKVEVIKNDEYEKVKNIFK